MEISYVKEGDIYRVINKTDEVLTSAQLLEKKATLSKVLADLKATQTMSPDALNLANQVTQKFQSQLNDGSMKWADAVGLVIADFRVHLDAIEAIPKDK